MQVYLTRPDSSVSWGFRLQGGLDFNRPLSIQTVQPNSVADLAGLKASDIILSINGVDARSMKHEEAKMQIIRSANDLQFQVQRGGQYFSNNGTAPAPTPAPAPTVWKPTVSNVTPAYSNNQFDDVEIVTHTSLAANKPDSMQIGAGHNRTAQPFGSNAYSPPDAVLPGADGRIRKVAHNQFNSPMGLYSDKQVSDVYQSRLQDATRNFQAAVESNKNAPPPALPGTMYCGMCGDMIKGVFVKVQGKIPMHPDCLKCSKCGVGLRHVGYFYIEGKLYCELHAKQVAKPPEPGMKPMTVYK